MNITMLCVHCSGKLIGSEYHNALCVANPCKPRNIPSSRNQSSAFDSFNLVVYEPIQFYIGGKAIISVS